MKEKHIFGLKRQLKYSKIREGCSHRCASPDSPLPLVRDFPKAARVRQLLQHQHGDRDPDR
jgi:hypothetical protein